MSEVPGFAASLEQGLGTNSLTLPFLQTATAEQYGPIADGIASQYNINPQVFRSLISSESAWDPYAQNGTSGAAGLGQIIPSNVQAMGLNPWDPTQNLTASAQILSGFLKQSNGDYGSAIAMYKGFQPNGTNWQQGLSLANNVLTGAGTTGTTAGTTPTSTPTGSTGSAGVESLPVDIFLSVVAIMFAAAAVYGLMSSGQSVLKGAFK